jgi:hypothetical protein
MEEHHHRVAGLSGELTRTLTAWRATAGANDRAAAADILDQLVAVLREHLGMEERLVMPLVEQHVSAAEWNSMSAVRGDEFTQDQIPLVFGMVLYEGEPAAIADELAGLSPATRPVFENAARTAYAAYAEILYGTPDPPRIGVDPLSDKD